MIFEKETDGLIQLTKLYDENKSSVLGLYRVEKQLLSSYGVVEWENLKKDIVEITSIVEKPVNNPPSDMAVIGRYVFNPSIFSCLEKTKPGVGGEIQLTDAINEMIKSEKIYGVTIHGNRFDISRFEEYLAANQYIQPFIE